MNILEAIEQVRTTCYEFNTDALNDSDIARFLNRGQRQAQNILSIRYEEFFNQEYFTDLVSSQQEYTLPSDCVGSRVKKVDIIVGDYAYEVERTSLNRISKYDFQGSTSYPTFYMIYQNKIRLYPQPTESISDGLRIYYSKKYKELDISQGTIQSTEISSFTLDAITSDNEGNYFIEAGDYIYISDPVDGSIRGTYLIGSIDSTNLEISVKSSLGPFTVSSLSQADKYFQFSSSSDFQYVKMNDTFTISGSTGNDGTYTITLVDSSNYRLYVSESITSSTADGSGNISIGSYLSNTISTNLLGVRAGDLVTLCPYTPVSELPETFHDYLIQFAVVEVLKKLKEPIEEEFTRLKELESDLKQAWADRPPSEQVVFKENGYDELI